MNQKLLFLKVYFNYLLQWNKNNSCLIMYDDIKKSCDDGEIYDEIGYNKLEHAANFEYYDTKEINENVLSPNDFYHFLLQKHRDDKINEILGLDKDRDF